MDVILRADASATMGMGHLSRVSTLAAALGERGGRCTIATHRPSPGASDWLARTGHTVVTLEAADDAAELIACSPRASWVLVDGYHLDARYRRALRAIGPVGVFDDVGEQAEGADLVLNGNLYGDELVYDVPAGTRLLLGPSYAIVREEFVRAREARLHLVRPPGQRPRVLVTMGGADPTRASEGVLRALRSLPPLDVRIAVGAANPHYAAIVEVARAAHPHEVEVVVGAPMGPWMTWCDVAVTAAGSTCLELAAVGVPAVALGVADNQRLVVGALSRRKLMATARDVDDVAPLLDALLADSRRRRNMEEAQRAAVDGGGSGRVAAELMSQPSAA